MFYVYLLKSLFHKEFYVGSTNDLKQRMKDHNPGKVFSTKRCMPWKLLYYEAYLFEKFARIREQRLKHHGNSMKELRKRIGLVMDLPSTTFKNLLKSGAGFTLIELLVVIGVLSVVGSIMTGVVTFSLRGANKTQTIENIRQSGNYTISQMGKTIQYAETFDVSNDGINYVRSCPFVPSPTPLPVCGGLGEPCCTTGSACDSLLLTCLADTNLCENVKRVFVTSGDFYAPDFGGYKIADQICGNLAPASVFRWVAWISDRDSNVAERVPNQPYYRLDGVKVSNGRPFKILLAPINIDENGRRVRSGDDAWTGVSVKKNVSGDNCDDWTSVDNSDSGTRGLVDSTDESWTTQGNTSCSSNSGRVRTKHLYCFET